MDAAGLNYIKKSISLAPGEMFDVYSVKYAGLLIISEGFRGAVFAFAKTYTAGKDSIVTLFEDKDGEFTTIAGQGNTIHFGLVNGRYTITNNYDNTRNILISIL